MAFEGFTRETAELQAKYFSDLYNEQTALVYESALRQWLIDTQIKQAAGLPILPMPTAGRKVEYYLDPIPSTTVRMRYLDELVSKLTLADIIPKYGTDIDMVGNGIGGPIPNEPNKFYMASDDKRFVGAPPVVITSGKWSGTYVKVQENPFKTYYLKVA